MKKIFLLLLILVSTFCQIATAKNLNEGGEMPFSRVFARSIGYTDIKVNKLDGESPVIHGKTAKMFSGELPPPPPQGSLTANNLCGSGTGQLTWTAATGGATAGPFTIFYSDGTGVTKQALSVSSGIPFNVANPVTVTTTYTIITVIDASGTSSSTTSGFVFTQGSATINVLPTVTVNPTSDQWICRGAPTAAINFSSTATGGTIIYNWTNDNTATGLAASGMGTIASFNGTNTTSAPIVSTITVTPIFTNTAGTQTCTGVSSTFKITVNPAVTVTSTAAATQVVCPNSTASIPLSNPITGGTIINNWTNNTTSIGLGATGAGSISFTATNITDAPVTSTIVVTPSYTNTTGGSACAGPTSSYMITVNPVAKVNTIGAKVFCHNETTAAITLSSPTTGGTIVYNWVNNTPSIGLAASGIGNIPFFTATNTTLAPVVATITVTPSFTNGSTTCVGTPEIFTITVNPTATVNAVTNQIICDNTLTTAVPFTSPTTGGTIVYNWTNSNTSIGTGLTTPSVGNLSAFTGTNALGTGPVVATISVTPSYTNAGKTCAGTLLPFTITVNPVATVNTVSDQVLCNGSPVTAIAFSSGTIPTTDDAIIYNWTNNESSIGLAASGLGNIPTFSAVNTGTAPIVATITVTPSYVSGTKTCTGTPKTFKITVNPTPIVAAVTNQVICNGSPTTAVSFSSATTGVVYNWVNNTPSIGLAASGSGTIPSFTATNATTAPVVATITVTPSYTNAGTTCTGAAITFTITVNPTVVAPTVSNQVICDGSSTSATFAPATGVTYTWANNTTSIGLAASGTGDIAAFTATNSTGAPVVATITVTPSYLNGGVTCVGTASIFTITVNPKATVAAVTNQVICNGSPTTAIALTSTTTGGTITYDWVNNTTSIGLAASGTGDIASFTAVNTGTTPVTASITVIPTYTTGTVVCIGTPLTFTITVNPTVTVTPTTIPNQTICNGSMATAVTFGSATTGVVYNWVNSTPSIGLAATGTGNIAAFTATNSDITPVTATITVTPSYTNGSVTCIGTPSTFTITINALPAITVQPTASETLCAGSRTVTLSVTATGTGLTYQWKKGTTDINGAKASTYDVTSAITDAASTTDYTVVVGGTCAPSVTSMPSTVTIQALPKITVQPVASTTVCAGSGTVTLSVTAEGTGLNYQWKRGIFAVGGNSSTYSITSTPTSLESNFTYSVIVSGTCAPSVTSTNAVVKINALPAITVHPEPSTTLCAGLSTILKVEAKGSGVTYQWKKDDEIIPGANTDTYEVISFVTDAASNSIYTVEVGGTCGSPLISDDAEVIVDALPKITVQPTATQTLCAGSRTVNLSVTATGTDLTYQWQKDGVDITDAKSATYDVRSTATDLASTSIYTVVVGGKCTPSVTSAEAKVIINELPRITVQPVAATTFCAGTPTTLSVTATGSGLTYQWLKGNTDISGATSATYAIPSTAADAQSTSTYMVLVKGTCGSVLTSTDAIVKINSLPKITAEPVASTTLCAGLGTTLTVAATGTGVTYQWQKNGTAITGETSASIVVGSTTADAASTSIYTVVVGGTCTPSVTSANSTVVINALPSITTQPLATTAICAGTGTTLSVVATGTGLTYQWKKDGTDITGATTASYAITTAAADLQSKAVYSVAIAGTCTPSVLSANATVTVNQLPKITAQPTPSTTICAGSSTVNLSVTATGTGLTYQWKKGGTDITGATSATYDVTSTTTDAASTSTYTVVVGGTCTPTLTSANAVVTVNALLKVTARPAALTTVCVGLPATLSVTAMGTGLTYQWQKDSVNITGATNAAYTVDATTAANNGVYSVIIGSTCSPVDTSANVVLVIDPKPSAIMGSNSVNATFTTTFTNTVLGGTWSSSDTLIAKVDTAGVVSGILAGTVTISYTVANACGVITVKKDFTVIRNTVLVNAKVFLQGPYNPNNGFMDATLRVNGYLPSVEPYSSMSNFVHKGSGGGELFDNPAVTTIIGNNAIVDWVFIELRDKADPKKVVATRSALLQRDGDIVDTDGTSSLTLYDVIAGDYYIAIRHRNHLGFRTASAKTLNTTALTLNFTDGSTEVFGRNPLKLIGAAYTMYAGNGDSNGAINAIDKNNVWLRSNGLFNYLRADFNMDGAVNALDRNQYWLLNNSQVQQLD
jgi:hypothetical protein